MVRHAYNYPTISGLKDKEVQDRINKEVEEVGKSMLSEIETKFASLKKQGELKINQKNINAFLSYNYNNVIFIEYGASIDFPYTEGETFQKYRNLCLGYDLNTGERIKLEDVFKPGSDYKTKLNNFVCQYIIEHNYDDYNSERMTKPFQGIRDYQSFSLSSDGLIIILDEKNDEFVYYGSPEYVFIPMKALQDELYIFDRYFEEGKNIYEKEKLSKKLLPNTIEFKANKLIQEEDKKYFLSIVEGEFINVPDKEIEAKLNEMVQCSLDIDAFKKKAKNESVSGRMSYYNFRVDIFLNSGGYLSVASNENLQQGGRHKNELKPFNYDFGLNKELNLEDIYTDLESLKEEMKRQIEINRIPVPEEILDSSIEKAIQTNKFYFDEYAVVIYFSQEGVELESYNQWIWIPWNELIKDKIKFLQ
jgi:hypothetical protein